MTTDSTVRIATFNTSLNRNNEGDLIANLSTGDDTQAQAIAETIQRNNPDIILINEFDFDDQGTDGGSLAAELFQQNYLSVSQNGADPVEYPFVYIAPSNTGVPSGFDLDNSGGVDDFAPSDAQGFGFFEGQFGMVLFSKYEILTDDVRTFQNFLWKDMPNALLPADPNDADGNGDLDNWFTEEELEVVRLSSKSHWDVPINVNGEVIHVLASHPTPPVFDGVEDRNGTRNHDEIRFWADYVDPGQGGYIYDDAEYAAAGNTTPGNPSGGLEAGVKFVILGDQNADPFDGDSTNNAAQQLVDNSLINSFVTPQSAGGPEDAVNDGGINDSHQGNPAFDTSDFGDPPGNLRVDYVLPSQNLEVVDSGVFWPETTDPQAALVTNSDHRLVFADLQVTNADRKSVTAVELLGEDTVVSGTLLNGTTIGGISGLAYDAETGIYYALSDDRTDSRFYQVAIDLRDGSLDDGDITFNSVTTLTDENGDPFAANVLDPEGIALTDNGTFFISSEGDANALINPFVNAFSLAGQQIDALPVDDKFLPTADQSSGIHTNAAFESLTLTPDQRFLYTATEDTLFQDGPRADLDQAGTSRIIQYDLATGEAVAEFIYELDPVADTPDPANGFRINGLVELLAIDNNGTLLALERSFSQGVGNTVKLYQVQTQGALNVIDQPDIFDEVNGIPFEIDPAVTKELLVDFADLGLSTVDNLEALALGPVLEDGRQSLIVASDDNFTPAQVTQFIALGLDLETTPAVLPSVETPVTQDDGDALTPLVGDSDDPAIWVHPTEGDQSIVIGTLKDGGLAVFDLAGNVLQTITPADVDPGFGFGDIRYNNVDLVYGFNLNGESVDLAVASDRRNDTLAIFQINPNFTNDTNVDPLSIIPLSGLTDSVDPGNTSGTLFNVNDPGGATAYGLATYTSPVSGVSYAFITQADGNQVAQVQLIDNSDGTIGADIVRILTLPVPTGDAEDSQSEGIVVDQELGLVYVATEADEDGFGIFRFLAEPDGGTNLTLIQPSSRPELVPDIEGLNIYYGANGAGYLLANSQGDSSYAVFNRQGPNEYLGSFVIGDNASIDQVNESDGLDIINVSLGDAFPNGLAVFQDGANDPQNAVEDDEELENNSTNFKFVDWAAIANSFDIPLDVDTTSFDPRNPQVHSLINGVASGDVTQASAILWARSILPGDLTFEYSTDENFGTIVGTATATVTDINQPVKVEVTGLNSATEYFYRATDAAGATDSGRFLTAAEVGERTGLTFGISGDWQQAPPYPILSSAAEQELDFFVKLGDTIYADLETPATPGISQARTLEQFRAKHSEVLSPRFGLSATSDLYATTSILASIDDHEIVDNFAGGAAPGESPDAPDIGSSDDPLFTDDVEFVNDTQAYEDALQAYQEYHPLRDEFYDTPDDARTDGERKLYRANQYGSDAAVFVLDSRSFRDVQLDPADLNDPTSFLVEAFDPTRTLLGRAQLDQVKTDLLTAQQNGTTWKFVLIPEPIQNFGVVNAEDRFEGYAAERTELLSFIDQNGIDNVVFMAGDFHGTIVNNLTYQTAAGQEQIATNAFEVVTGPVAFFDGRFGPSVVNLSLGAGLIDQDQLDFYNTLPVAPDTDNIVDDKDDFLEQLLIGQTDPLGYDPVGLDNNLASADGLIDATLLQGDYVAAHNFSWTEFDIDETTQALTVTTYGIDAYSEADVLADPDSITNLTPQVISEFVVNPVESSNFTLQLLHVADQEASIGAIEDAPNLSAVLNALTNQDANNDGVADFANTLTLSSGDAFIPGVFFDASAEVFGSGGIADIQIQNELGFQAIALGNHEFDFGTETLAGLIDGSAEGTILGADFTGAAFPYLSTNLDFSTDENLAPLAVDGGQTPQANTVTSSVVIDVNGEDIGVIGATTPTLGSISSPGGVGISPSPFDANPTDAQLDALAAEIQLEVDALIAADPTLNKIVLLAHMQQLSIELALAERLENVDIIVAGGSNTRLFDDNDRLRDGDSDQGQYPQFIPNAGGTQTAVVNTDGSYKYVGRLVLDFDAEGNIIPDSYDENISGAYATDAQGVADLNAEGLVDPEIQQIVDAIEAQIIATESNVFGISDVFLNGNRSGTFTANDPDGVRTQETNLGNLTADANLAEAKKTDATVVASIKNGGGIRASIGETLVPPGGTEAVRSPNSELVDSDGNLIKPEGGISQTDIATTLAFNNDLVLLTLTRQELLDLLEHGVSALPDVSGRFPQIAGIKFSFDPDLTEGDRIQNAGIFDENDNLVTELVRAGELVGDANETFRIVTLGFLAAPRFDDNGNFTGGGDGYPFPNLNTDPSVGEVGDSDVIARVNLVELEQEGIRTGDATFADDGTEQDALAEYLDDNFSTAATAFNATDTGPALDERIQNLNFRNDTVLPDVVDPGTGSGIDLDDSDEDDGIVALLGLTTLTFTLTVNNTSFVNELVVFKVEDNDGTVLDSNGAPLTPNDANFNPGDYLQAILDSEATEVVLSTLDDSDDRPDAFQGESGLEVELDFDDDIQLGFLLVADATLDDLEANPAGANFFISTLAEAQLDILDTENFVLRFGDDESDIFDDLEFTVTVGEQDDLFNAAAEFLNVGRVLKIVNTSVEVIDLRQVDYGFDFNSDGVAEDITGQSIAVQVTLYREAAFDNLIGFYAVEASDGSVNGIAPGDRQAYAEAAYNSRVGEASAPGNESTSTVTFTFTGGQLLLPFLIANDSSPNADFSNIYFPFLAANADGADHIRLLGRGIFGIEDLPNGGDQDFDDVIIQINTVSLA